MKILRHRNLFWVAVAALSCAWSIAVIPAARAAGDTPQMVGGPCNYERHMGRATITSINEIPSSTKSMSGEKKYHKVMFTFQPYTAIDSPLKPREGREFPMTWEGSERLDSDFVQRNGIRVGAELEAYVDLITRGTCTPRLFGFENLQ